MPTISARAAKVGSWDGGEKKKKKKKEGERKKGETDGWEQEEQHSRPLAPFLSRARRAATTHVLGLGKAAFGEAQTGRARAGGGGD